MLAGVHIANSIGQASTRKSFSVGMMSVQDSVIVVNQSNFTNCSAASLNDSSLGTSSVFGGAFAVLHLPQVSNFRLGVLESSDTRNNATWFNREVLVSSMFCDFKCIFRSLNKKCSLVLTKFSCEYRSNSSCLFCFDQKAEDTTLVAYAALFFVKTAPDAFKTDWGVV